MAKNPRLPRLNRKGDGYRKHKLNAQRVREVVVQDEIEALKTSDRRKKAFEGTKRAHAVAQGVLEEPERLPNGRRKRRPGLERPEPEVKNGLINLKAFDAPDPKVAHRQEKLSELDQEMLEDGRRARGLILEEKIFILESYFSKRWGPKKIAKLIGRASSTVTRFIDRYRSTATMARLHFEAQAENLAKRVTSKANVEEAMEVLDRIDVLPKKDRKEQGGTSFNIIVGMPGQPGTRGAIPVPSQKQIEAARGGDE